MVLSLQGCMAVGKTSAARRIKENMPDVHVFFENTTEIIKTVKARKLDKSKFEDYIEIQRIWLKNEILRYKNAERCNAALMDFGAEEIEFYTLNYPDSLGKNWSVENALHAELEEARRCMPDYILFLDASDEVLRKRKNKDISRPREFFDYYIENLLPLKRKWFTGRQNVKFLDTSMLSPAETGEYVQRWLENCIKTGKTIAENKNV